MPRLEPLELENLAPDQKRVADAIIGGRIGAIRGPSEAWLRSPAFADLAQQMVAYCRYDTVLPADVVELVILLTGKHWRSQLEFWGHSRMAHRAGVPREAIEAIRIGERPELPREDLVVAYDTVTEYFRTNRLSDESYARALEAFGERGLVDLIAAAGLYGLVSMTLNIFDVTVPEGQVPPFEE